MKSTRGPLTVPCGATKVVEIAQATDLDLMCGLVGGTRHTKHIASTEHNGVSMIFVWEEAS